MIDKELVCVAAARGLWLWGREMRDRNMTRAEFCDEISVKDAILGRRGAKLGVHPSNPGLRFFDAARGTLAYGPGAGLVLSASVGTQSLRAALVDASGDLHNNRIAVADPEQLAAHPDDLLGRLRDTFGEVLEEAFDEKKLLVKDKLPLMGVSVAWPAPLTRGKQPRGHALRSDAWRTSDALHRVVSRKLKIEEDRSSAINDAAAAAIGVAFLQTTAPQHHDQKSPRLTIVLRLAGGVGGATIVIEPPEKDHSSPLGPTSGFRKSILIGGVDHLAGEIGHVPVEAALIRSLNQNLPDGLGDLEASGCSCTPVGEASPQHLEAYVSTGAVARRLDPDALPDQVAENMLADPSRDAHQRVLTDVGKVVGKSLLGPVAMLNPATVVLTGALGVKPVASSIEDSLSADLSLATMPEIIPLDPEENDFIRVKGAGMVVLRERLLRQLPRLLRGSQGSLTSKVEGLTQPLAKIPW